MPRGNSNFRRNNESLERTTFKRPAKCVKISLNYTIGLLNIAINNNVPSFIILYYTSVLQKKN